MFRLDLRPRQSSNRTMAELYIVCRPNTESSGLEVAATFRNKDQADRELDRLNLLGAPQDAEWRLLIKAAS